MLIVPEPAARRLRHPVVLLSLWAAAFLVAGGGCAVDVLNDDPNVVECGGRPMSPDFVCYTADDEFTWDEGRKAQAEHRTEKVVGTFVTLAVGTLFLAGAVLVAVRRRRGARDRR
jgi:hypothetical protein